MDTIADYNAWKSKQQQSGVGAAQVVLGSVNEKPDEVAGDLNLANEFGKATGNPVPPLPMVREYRNVFQQKIEEQRNKTILSSAPRLTEWLRSPQNAALARDDLANLSWWESAGRAVVGTAERGIERVKQAGNQVMFEQTASRAGDRSLSFGQILRDERTSSGLKDMQGNPLETWTGAEYVGAFARWVDARYADAIGTDDQAAAQQFASNINANLEKIASIPKPLMAQAFEKNAMVKGAGPGEAVANFATAFLKDPLGGLSWAATTAGESAPQLITALGATVATRNPAVGIAAMGAGSYATERYTSPAEFFQEKGIDLGKPEDVQRLMADPKLMGEAAERGVIRGLVIGAFDMLSAGVAGRTLAGNPLVELLAQGAQQAIMGSGGELTARLAAGQEIDWNEVIAEGFAEIASAPVDMGIAGREFQHSRRKAKAAEATVAEIGEISANAQASALRNRTPDTFRQFVEAATENGPVENVFVPAEDFSTYFQSLGLDPYALVDELEGVTRDDLDAALAGGGDLQIPTATYAAKLAGTEHDAFLMENMRFDPNEFTALEAKQFNERAQDALDEAWQAAEVARREAEGLRSFEQQTYDTMVSQLREAGRSTDVATTEATLYPAFYRTMAERSGMTIEEFLQAYPLPQVRGSLPEGMQFRDVDALNRTLAEARARRSAGLDKRQSLLEFISDYGGINDVGGELKARDAAVIKRKGKKSLKLARGVMAGVRDMFGQASGKKHGVDDVAQAAIEAGFLANDPVAVEYRNAVAEGRQVPNIGNALIDAIDRELRGEADYATQIDASAADHNAQLDQIEAYLSSLGVSLDDSDDAIRSAVSGDQENQGREYGQAARERDADIWRSKLRDLMQRKLPDNIDLRVGRVDAVLRALGVPAGQIIFRASKIRKVMREHGEIGVSTLVDLPNLISDPLLVYGEVGKESDLVIMTDRQTKDGDPIVIAIKSEGTSGNHSATVVLTVYPLNDAEKRLGEVSRAGRIRYVRESAVSAKSEPTGANSLKGLIAQALGQRPRNSKILSATDVFKGGKSYDQPAYHGTPHLFDKFSTDHIGTGEGNQAFGWGLYFAGRKEVAEYYRDTLSEPVDQFYEGSRILSDAEALAAEEILRSGGKDGAFAFMEKVRRDNSQIADLDWVDRVIAAIVSLDETKLRKVTPKTSGRLFEVEVPDDSDLLAWDRSLSKQSDAVQSAIRSMRAPKVGLLSNATRKFRSERLADIFAGNDWDKTTANQLYGALALALGGDKAASAALSGAGIPGHRYLDGGSRSDGEGTYNYVIYDDNRVAVTSYEQSGDVRGPRGLIQFPGGGVGNGETVVRLFESADLSTFLHESGHYFLTVLRDLAEKGEVSAAADMSSVREWWRSNADAVAKDGMRVMPDVVVTADDVIAALDGGTTGDMMKDAAIDVGMQEQWARGFESYLMEGKAPSIELRGAFEKFRSWLISVYRKLAGLNVSVSDNMREVFDRMLASDNEIARAKEQAGDSGPIFATAEQMGLTPGEFASFLKLRDQAEDDAKARLLREAMAPVKRAQEKWFKDERAKVRDEVERDVNTYRYYRAWEWMGNRRWLGEGDRREGMPDIRLSKEILVQRYGEGVLKTLPRGMQTVYAVEGGIDPDDAAGWFGFDSGDELVQALEKAPPRKEAIEAETDKIMRERHGDVLNDGAVEAAALDALHSDKRGQWIAAELKAVVEVAGAGIGLTAKEARASARASIARMKVRDAINASRFLAAERKAADEAAKLGAMLARESLWMQKARRRIATKARAAMREAGSVDAVAPQIERANASTGNYNETVARLVEVKRRQLINHALYMEARNVADEVEKAENFVAKLAKKSTREKIAGAGRRENAGVDYLGAIDEILERYDFRKLSGAAEDRRGALNAFVAAMTAAGRENELAIPEAVLSDAARRPYKTLPVEEMRGVIDSLKNLEHVALRWNKLIDAQKQRDLEAAVADISAAFDANMPKRPPSRVGTKAEARRHSVRQFFDLVLNAGTLLREIDGFKDQGAAYRNIKTPIDEAMDRLIVRKEKAAGDLEKLYSVYSKEDRRAMAVRKHIPELGYALSKWERIAVALNLGNEGNRSRLTDPKVRGSLTDAQVEAVIATLDARDADFVQSVWDYVGSFRDDIAARERRATGVEPQWVEASPVEIAGKTLKGGYYPLKYDPRLSSLARDDEANNIAQALQAGRFGKAQTRQGHLKERAKSSGRDIELDMSVLHRHVNQVIYDLELSEPVANSWRILQNGEIRSAFMDAGKQADFDALEIWLKDVAEGELKSADLVGRGARMLKSNFTAAKLAFNLVTVAQQVTGLAQSMVVVGKKDMAVGIMQAAKNPISAARDIAAVSPFMASRQTTFNKDIFDFYNDPKIGPTATRWGEIKSEIVGPLAFWMMTKTQWYMADVPTWLAGYRQGLRQNGNDEAKAIAHADAVVKRAQASGLFADRSAIERGSVSRTARQNDVVRLFTALGSYMFAKFNVAYERTAKAKRLIGDEGVSARSAQEALSWTLDMTFLFTLEAVVGVAIRGQLPSGDDDDKEDGWMAFLAKQTGFSVMATIPGVRDVAGPLQGFDGGGSYGAITKEIATPFVEAVKSIEKGEVTQRMVKSTINATALATGLPATQINRAVDAAWRESEGKDVSPLEYLLGKIGKK